MFVLFMCVLQAAGKYRQQGRNYVVEDGDIIFFKFNTPNAPKKKWHTHMKPLCLHIQLCATLWRSAASPKVPPPPQSKGSVNSDSFAI